MRFGRVRSLLYQLKRQHPGSIQIYRTVSGSADPRTGRLTTERLVIDIPRAIVVPARLETISARPDSVQSASKPTFMSSYYPRGIKTFIIDANDCPPGFELQTEDWIVYRGAKFNLDRVVEELEDQRGIAGWVVVGQEVKGDIPERTLKLKVDNYFGVADSLEVEDV